MTDEQYKEMPNDEILKRISMHHEAIKKLQKQLKPAEPVPVATLAESNKDLRAQRDAAFKKKQEEQEAIQAALVIARENKRGNQGKR